MKKHTPLIVLITGASGSGKTVVAKALQHRIDETQACVYFFDDIGVPSTNEMIKHYGSPEKWQQLMTHTWIEKLLQQQNKLILILEGSFNPEFAVEKMQTLHISHYLIICLQTLRNVREKRLIHDRNQPELANQDMENFSQFLAQKTQEIGGLIIDSTHKSIYEITDKIYNLIKNKI